MAGVGAIFDEVRSIYRGSLRDDRWNSLVERMKQAARDGKGYLDNPFEGMTDEESKIAAKRLSDERFTISSDPTTVRWNIV